MNTADFDYALPSELIAQEPPPERTDARMLVVRRDEDGVEHRKICDIGDYLQRGDLLVVNNTRVIPARLTGIKPATGGAVELLLLEPITGNLWLALCRSSRQPAPGTGLILAGGRIRATVTDRHAGGKLTVRLDPDGPLLDVLDQAGQIPLPPYIKRPAGEGRRATDAQRYQTVYASEPGAVAAPTAGLHFTPELLAQLQRRGIGTTEITLHVGIGTFRPVSVEHVREHRMDAERYSVSDTAATAIRDARAAGGRVVAVGSTTVRTLETIMRDHGEIVAGDGRSDLFIYPPFPFRAVDVMLTNFHLPRSTLLMMVSALAGISRIREAYAEAIREKYRFFSYGDCMLIL